MFKSEFKESKENVVKIQENIKFNVFRMLLVFIYSSDVKVEESEDVVEFLELFALADCYGLKELCELSSKLLKSCLTVANVCLLLNKSEKVEFNSLSRMIQKFILKNLNEVRKSEDFKTSSKTRIIEILKENVENNLS